MLPSLLMITHTNKKMPENQTDWLENLEKAFLEKAQDVTETLPENFEEAFFTKSNFILESNTFVEFGGEKNPGILVSRYQTEPNFNDEVLLVGDDLDSIGSAKAQSIGLIVRVAGGTLNDDLFYMISQNLKRFMLVKGIMVKGTDSTIWIRVSRSAQEAGIKLSTIGTVLLQRIRDKFPEVEAARIIIIDRQCPLLDELVSNTKREDEEKFAMKAKVWDARGYNFEDCKTLGHCGQCSDKKLCANIRKMDRLAEASRIEIKRSVNE